MKSMKGGSVNNSWAMMMMMLMGIIVSLFVIILHLLRGEGVHYRTSSSSSSSTNVSLPPQPPPSDALVFNNPYTPPLKTDQYAEMLRPSPPQLMLQYAPSNRRINLPTQGMGSSYSQLGIVTARNGHSPPTILPLMGRRIQSGRDKLQYYTISNTGMVNTKLPIRVKNRSCTGEYGCDEIFSGDAVFVEGYNEEFIATIYENASMAYLPI